MARDKRHLKNTPDVQKEPVLGSRHLQTWTILSDEFSTCWHWEHIVPAKMSFHLYYSLLYISQVLTAMLSSRESHDDLAAMWVDQIFFTPLENETWGCVVLVCPFKCTVNMYFVESASHQYVSKPVAPTQNTASVLYLRDKVILILILSRQQAAGRLRKVSRIDVGKRRKGGRYNHRCLLNSFRGLNF